MCALSDAAAQSSVVLDRDPDQEKSLDPSGPRIRCPLCGWSPRKDDLWACDCGHLWNTFDTWGVCHGMPPPVDFYTMPFLYPLVAAFGLVCAVTRRCSPREVVSAKARLNQQSLAQLPRHAKKPPRHRAALSLKSLRRLSRRLDVNRTVLIPTFHRSKSTAA